MKTKQAAPYPLRTSDFVRGFLKSSADANKRSLNAEINLILERYIEAEIQKQKAA